MLHIDGGIPAERCGYSVYCTPTDPIACGNGVFLESVSVDVQYREFDIYRDPIENPEPEFSIGLCFHFGKKPGAVYSEILSFMSFGKWVISKETKESKRSWGASVECLSKLEEALAHVAPKIETLVFGLMKDDLDQSNQTNSEYLVRIMSILREVKHNLSKENLMKLLEPLKAWYEAEAGYTDVWRQKQKRCVWPSASIPVYYSKEGEGVDDSVW